MITVIGISGSLRRGSFNTAVLRAGGSLMPADSELRIESIEGIPLYNGDDEATNGVPDLVSRLKGCDYRRRRLAVFNHRNTTTAFRVLQRTHIDWLSRPPSDIAQVFGGKPVAIAGASPGGFGTILSQNAWLPVFRTLGADLWSGGRLFVSRAGQVVDTNGEIPSCTRENIRRFLEGFVAYIRGRRQPTS